MKSMLLSAFAIVALVSSGCANSSLNSLNLLTGDATPAPCTVLSGECNCANNGRRSLTPPTSLFDNRGMGLRLTDRGSACGKKGLLGRRNAGGGQGNAAGGGCSNGNCGGAAGGCSTGNCGSASGGYGYNAQGGTAGASGGCGCGSDGGATFVSMGDGGCGSSAGGSMASAAMGGGCGCFWRWLNGSCGQWVAVDAVAQPITQWPLRQWAVVAVVLPVAQWLLRQ